MNKRVFESLVKAGAFDSLANGGRGAGSRSRRVASAAAACGDRRRVRARRPRPARHATKGRRSCSAASHDDALRQRNGTDAAPLPRRRRRGPRPSSWRSRRKRSVSTGAATRSIGYAGELKNVRRAVDRRARRAPVPAPARRRLGRRAARKPIEPDTSVGGIVAACRQLKTRKGDRMAVFTLEDAQGGVEVIAFPETYQRAASVDRDGHDGARPRKARTRRRDRCGSWRRRSCRSTRVRERLAREVAIRVQACRPTAASSRRSARSSRAIAAIGACRSRSTCPAGRWARVPALRRGCASRPRCRRRSASARRPALIAEVEQVVGQGAVSLR